MSRFRGLRHLTSWHRGRRSAEFVFEVLVPEPYAADLRALLRTHGLRPTVKSVRRILGRSRLTRLMPAPRPTAILTVETGDLTAIDRLAEWYERQRFVWPLLWVGIQAPGNEWRLDFAHHTAGEIKQLVEIDNHIRRVMDSAVWRSAPPVV